MMMNEARFMELLAAYGAELSRWPESERGAAAAMLEAASHRLKDVWESERVFDGLLGLERDVLAPVSLEKRLIAAAPARSPKTASRSLFGRWTPPQWATGGAIAASLALGFAVGYAGEPQSVVDAGAVEVPQMLSFTQAGSAVVLLSDNSSLN